MASTLKADERLVVAVPGGYVLLVNGKPSSVPCRITSSDTIATVPARSVPATRGA